ncbi:MAG: hypothetical protein JEZ09_15900 [Salinivirgaceae bacterium]|nr:hypothetical protein [Salinivirgaceae bacterium]
MITVKICRGTLCHVMGGSDLPLIPDFISEKIKPHVYFEGTTCLGFCNQDEGLKPPFVEVDGKIVSEATISKVIESIETAIKNK